MAVSRIVLYQNWFVPWMFGRFLGHRTGSRGLKYSHLAHLNSFASSERPDRYDLHLVKPHSFFFDGGFSEASWDKLFCVGRFEGPAPLSLSSSSSSNSHEMTGNSSPSSKLLNTSVKLNASRGESILRRFSDRSSAAVAGPSGTGIMMNSTR